MLLSTVISRDTISQNLIRLLRRMSGSEEEQGMDVGFVYVRVLVSVWSTGADRRPFVVWFSHSFVPCFGGEYRVNIGEIDETPDAVVQGAGH